MAQLQSESFPTLAEADELRRGAVCTRFREDFEAGRRPQIEAFLDESDEAVRLPLLQALLRIEVEFRLREHETFAAEDYLRRFPEIEPTWLSAVLNPCPSSEQLHQYLAQELTGSTRDSLAHHINTCTECLSTLKGLENRAEPAAPERLPEPPPPNYAPRDIIVEHVAPEPPSKPSTALPPDGEPSTIAGRYQIIKVLGEGGFGRVYLAHDEQLDRRVAVKVPHPNRIAQPDDFEQFLAEARLLASFDHPHIVPVHDTGRTEDGLCYVVSKFIAGTDLAEKITQSSTSFTEAAELVATVAEALHYAHHKGVVHRDVKPGNILLDTTGRPFVVDFGLALKDQDFGKGAGFAGTPNYMSPEQARGEGHRVDGRSDIFSLGVVFYELLTGRRPFRGETVMALLQHIASGEPRPPRQVDDSIPSELERICLKALAKRVSERYTTAQDLAVDLRHFLEHAPASIKSGVRPSRSSEARPAPPSTPKVSTTPELHPLRIIPKGLRSFDAHDADFFLELLPGPRDRAGLPDTIRFWKSRIEESDPDHSFAVGMIYGPSGCGKSSLVKAGLVPRLSDEVIVVYVEATAAETETRLLNGLRKRCPTLSTDLDLKETLADLRRQQGIPQGKKLLLVLDQFEQWLHVQKDPENTELVQALRQCDSGRVQCIVMVRDDFWMAVTRFMHALEIRLVEGQNSAVVDLFDLAHARKVLAALGRAFGKIPQTSEGTTKERKDFLTQAVSGLAQEGKVICVRLALFAEMMKGKSWTPATLKKMGGAQGVGLTFLEETFSAATAPPEHRYHQKAARAVLKALLPESGANIKGHMRTQADLLSASGYASRPKDFDELIHILDIDTRLITPTDPEGKDEGERTKGEPECPTDSSLRYYQLTHDYLVHSLRDWLTHKQRETKRGRAELLLADRAAFWTARPEIRELPSLAQWLRIHWRTQRNTWTRLERKMMRVANRYHLIRGLIAATVVVLLALIGWEGFGRLMAQTYRDRLLVASTADVPPIVADLAPYRRWADPLLKEAYAQADENHDSRRQLHLSLSLLPVDPGQTAYLYERLLKAEPEELIAIREALHSQRAGQLDRLWKVAENQDVDWEARFRAACALATFDPDNPRWQNINRDVAKRLTRNPLVVARWTEVLRPVAECLLPPLASFLEDETRSGSERGLIALVYGNYAANQPDAIAKLEQVLTIECKSNATVETRIALAKRQANIGAALMILGRTDKVWPLLKFSPDPTRRSFLIDRFASCNVDAQVLASRLKVETDASIRQALLLCLTEFGLDRLPEVEQKELPPRLLELYRNDADPGIRAAAEALVRKWNADEKLAEIDKDPADRTMAPGRRWYVDGQGHTMIVVPTPGETWVGEKDERHQRTINRSYAIASKEVTVNQFLRFRAKHISATKFSPTRDGPVGCVTWFDAVAYCNWLSEQEGIPSDQWCYLPNQNGEFANGMKMAPDYLGRTGYRLPTEAEWEYACRAGSITEWSHGDAEELIGKYAWCNTNSFERSRPVGKLKPNRLGLFDMHGNAWEWCQDRYVEIPIGNRSEDSGDLDGIHEDEVRVPRGGAYIFRPATSRSAFRHKFFPTERQDYVGFRPAKTLAGK